MDRKPSLIVELLAADGHCPQSCSHCGFGTNPPKETAPDEDFFSKDAVQTLAVLQAHMASYQRKIRRLSFATGLNSKNIPPLPLDPFPGEIDLVLGNIFPQETSSATNFPALVKQIIKVLQACVKDARPKPDRPPALNFSCIPKLTPDLILEQESVTFFIQLFSLLARAVLIEDIAWREVVFGLDNNTASTAKVLEAMQDTNKLLHNQALNIFIARKIGEAIQGKTFGNIAEERIDQANNFRDGVKEIAIQQIFSTGFLLTLYQRIVSQREQQSIPKPLDESDEPLIVTCLAGKVWIGHSTQDVWDKSLRISYEDFLRIVTDATASGDDLKTKVHEKINQQRKGKRKLVVVQG